jgi:hypothetical protein
MDAREEECRDPTARRVRPKLWHIPNDAWVQCDGHRAEEEDEDEEESEVEQQERTEGPNSAAAATSSAIRCPPLYADVLHCIFSFLPAAALCAASSVNRSWRAAVLSQPSNELAVNASTLGSLCLLLRSLVARRHVDALQTAGLRCTDLLLLSTLCPSLHLLQCHSLGLPPTSARAPLSWPTQLRRLDVALVSDSSRRLTAAFNSISRLPQLEMLFASFELSESVSWSALRRCSTLRSLELRWNPRHVCTKEQLDVLRAMPQLRVFRMTNWLTSTGLCYLLRPPHELQLQQLPRLHLDDAAAAALSNLPSLRNLFCAPIALTDYCFARQLPQLCYLTLQIAYVTSGRAAATELFLTAAAAGHFAHVADVRMDGTTDEVHERLAVALIAGRK